ncbi:indolethylamine N-methyltransferase-like [Dysidea avara]|uniref:indolethylamine N-methyltransferase-like n=1 Tax=Dysidea avara TaxID=196820 RepID=UPI003319FCDA
MLSVRRLKTLVRFGSSRGLLRSKSGNHSRNPYWDEFNTKDYLNTFYASYEGNPLLKGRFIFRWQQIYNFYSKYNSKWDNKTARLLEFGGGPAITPLISAVPYVNQITFSAYVESERKEVELWKERKRGAHDWSSHFKFVVNEVENISGDTAWREREELLRQRVSSIVPCDALNENPLLVEQEPFEIISTNLCLEAACTSYEEYKGAAKSLAKLLKPGGMFVTVSPERGTFYMFGGKKWPCLYITLEQVTEALSEAGMVVLVSERDPASMEQIQNPIAADIKAFVFLAAQKVEY